VEPADGGLVFADERGVRLHVAKSPSPPRAGLRYTLMVRPEKITLTPTAADARPAAAVASLAGEVDDVIYVGEFTRYRVRVAPGVVLGVKSPNTHAAWRAKPGDPVRLRWAVTDAYLVPSTD